jgi:hypothetical protein
MPSSNATVVTYENKALTSTPSAACTCACTSEGKNANDGPQDTAQREVGEDPGQAQPDPLTTLAAALLTLSPADRARLAAMLTGHQGERGTA